jgi:hypothetical protein
MGFSVQEALGDIKVVNMDSDTISTKIKPNGKEAKEDQEITDEVMSDDQTKKDDESSLEKKGEDKDEIDSEESNIVPVAGDNFGFVMDEDITKSSHHTHTSLDQTSEHKSFPSSTEAVNNPPTVHREQTLPDDEDSKEEGGGIFGFLAIIPTMLKSLKLPSLSLPVVGGLSKKFIILPAILILLVGLGLYYLLTVKAVVTLHMEPKKIDDSTTITLRTDSSNDLSQKILAAKEVDTAVDGTVSTTTTGKKDVGDKAKGTITFYNNSDSKKAISSGTTISSSNDLDFVTTSDVSVASASGDATSSKPGTASVGVTAKNIGSEYNLPSGTKFTIDGISSNTLAGKNDSAFSGGSKKTVTVVAQKDIDTLTTNLTKQLQDQAQDALKGKAGGDQQILPIFISTTLSKKSFDNGVGDEASKVTLKGTVTFTTFSYSTEDLSKVAQAAIQGKYDQNLKLSDKGIVTELQDVKATKDNEATASLVMDAGLLPKIDADTITQNISGKSFTDATSYLETLPQVNGAEIELSPNIPLLPKLLPRFNNHIKVVLQSND